MLNPNSIVLNWSLVRFYASAPNFVGGNLPSALQHAAYIYTLNRYLGCLAYEYAYTKSNMKDKAEKWYRNSLMCPLSPGMFWQEIHYNKVPQISLKIIGDFNNWKGQSMYENQYGSYYRRVMTPKCDNCNYKLVVDDRDFDIASKTDFIVGGL